VHPVQPVADQYEGEYVQAAGAHEPEAARRSISLHLSLPQRFPWVGTLLYRGWLLLTTALLAAALLYIQSLVGAVPPHPTLAQRVVQWAELIWLAPVPLAIALWLGWFFYADAARPDPSPVAVPWFTRLGQVSYPARLIFRFVTRGDNQDVLRDAVAAVHVAMANYPRGGGPYRVEIVTERPVEIADSADRVAVHVVPPDFETPHRSRFKARALTYLQSVVRPQPGDWYIYLDEESAVDTPMVSGLYRFIWRAHQEAARDHLPTPRLIGQGAILYQGGTWFFRGADALRTADDIGRFRLQYALGMPLFGVHGSYIVVSGEDDPQLSFDVGDRNSLTEDAAWALRAWSRGYRFGWVEGYLREQPPQRTADFVRQRARWLSGIRLVLRDELVPARYRACLGAFTVLWQLSFLPFIVTLAAVAVHIAPPVWMRLPADFAWATFVLAYLQGADAQAKRPGSAIESSARAAMGAANTPREWLAILPRRVASWVLALCYIWYALLEAAGVVYSLRPKKDFFVIYKPSLSRTGAMSSAPSEGQTTDLPAASASIARRPQG
jgi:egghead protein (zeste-white 4 protein)